MTGRTTERIASERVVADALARIAEEAPPVRLPTDLWLRGRRQHRRRVAAGVAAAVLAVLAAVPVVTLPDPPLIAAADGPDAVPSRVYAPMPFQASAHRSPPGPAALLVSGDGAFQGGGFSPQRRNLVVGRDGSYRLVGSCCDVAGEHLLLSPDGRYVAGSSIVTSWLSETSWGVLDLTTGRVRGYPGSGHPVAWTPDGQRLLTMNGTETGVRLRMLDLKSGQVRDLTTVQIGLLPRFFAAFSVDGSRLALQFGEELQVVDAATGDRSPPVHTGPRRRLAGPGAWLPDGRIAVFDMTGCDDDCDLKDVGSRVFRIAYLDPEHGEEVAGPQFGPVTGVGARLLGWQHDGMPVVAVFQADGQVRRAETAQYPDALPSRRGVPWQEDDTYARARVEVFVLDRDGGSSEVVTLPAGAQSVDIARDLLVAGRFGAPAPEQSERLVDWFVPLADRILLLILGVLALFAIRRLRRRIRAEGWHGWRHLVRRSRA